MTQNTPVTGALSSQRPRETEAAENKKKVQRAPRLSEPDILVTFLIGKDEPKKFIVHKQFACHYSPVLRAAFNGNFIEGKTQTYQLDDVSEGAFQLFVEWLYTQKFDLDELREDYVEKKEPPEQGFHGNMALHELWVLGDKFWMPALQNIALKTIEAISNKRQRVATSCLQYVWSNTSDGSLLRRYYVKDCAKYLCASVLKKHPERFPHEMMVDFVVYMRENMVLVGGDEDEDDNEGEDENNLSEFMVPDK